MRTRLFRLSLLCAALLLCRGAFGAAESAFDEADRFMAEGLFGEAAAWSEKHLETAGSDDGARLEWLSRLASAQQNLGDPLQALDLLKQALALEKAVSPARYTALLVQAAEAWSAAGDSESALKLAYQAVQGAEKNRDAALLGNAYLSLANVLSIAGYFDKALEFYDKAARTELPALSAKAHLNRLQALLPGADEADKLLAALKETENALARLKAGREKSDMLLSLADFLARRLIPTEQDETLRARAYESAARAFQSALEESRERGDKRSISLAYGGLAGLYERRGRFEEARQLNRQALFYVRQSNEPDIQYLWEWQQARLFQAQGDMPNTLKAFKRAAKTLNGEVRNTLTLGYRLNKVDFNQEVRPLYYTLAELLLEQAARADGAQQQALLQEAVDAVEDLKVAELQDYFHSECFVQHEAQSLTPAQLPAGTALIYPMPLAERLEVLIGLDGQWQRMPPLTLRLDDFNATLDELRLTLPSRSENAFLEPARQVYDWLLGPAAAQLREQHIDTLLFAPDGALRQIPPAALYDGKAFLIEEFAVAVTPSLRFVDLQTLSWEDSGVLLAGLSHAVQGYPPLPGVVRELNTIDEQARHSDKMLNREYSTEALRDKLGGGHHSVVHLASHAEFDADPTHTYVLTYEEKMSMDTLEKLVGLSRQRKIPVELLVLSACKTAVGDDRANLGLAGVAVKAGARSALASLWFVDDESTMLTMEGFYKRLFNTPGITKAKALQDVQKSLIQQKRYWHPGYWAPFLLIGNWL